MNFELHWAWSKRWWWCRSWKSVSGGAASKDETLKEALHSTLHQTNNHIFSSLLFAHSLFRDNILYWSPVRHIFRPQGILFFSCFNDPPALVFHVRSFWVPLYGMCVETGKITKSLNYGNFQQTGKMTKSHLFCTSSFSSWQRKRTLILVNTTTTTKSLTEIKTWILNALSA